jgi:hypothetical protein
VDAARAGVGDLAADDPVPDAAVAQLDAVPADVPDAAVLERAEAGALAADRARHVVRDCAAAANSNSPTCRR